jgi:hypothetical protein
MALMSPCALIPDISNRRLKRFLVSCKAALKHPAGAMASGMHKEDAIVISDDEDEVNVADERNRR